MCLLFFVVNFSLLVSFVKFLDLVPDFFFFFFEEFQVIDQFLVDIVLQVFFLVFGDIFKGINFFHGLIDDPIQFSNLVFDLFDFGMGHIDLFPGVKFQKRTFVHIDLAMTILQLPSEPSCFDLLLFFLLWVLVFVFFLLSLFLGNHLFAFQFLCKFFVDVFELFSQLLIFAA